MMQKIIYFIALLCIATSFNACKKYEPIGEGAWTDADTVKRPPPKRELVYATANGLFIVSLNGKNTKQLITNPATPITRVAISPKYDKIAYQSTAGISIIDTVGNVLKSNIATPNIKHFEWHKNNTLLYGSQDNPLPTADKMVALYGGDLPSGLPTLPAITTNTNYHSLVFGYIKPDGGLIFSRTGYNNNSNLVYIPNGATVPLKTQGTGIFAAVDFRVGNDYSGGIASSLPSGYYLYNIDINNLDVSAYSGYPAYNLRLAEYGSLVYENSLLKYVTSANYDRAYPECSNGCTIATTDVFDAK
jgi:hypothetical protein